ncbi:MAG: hypothetical protein R6W97_04870 [Thiobacillus sp.]
MWATSTVVQARGDLAVQMLRSQNLQRGHGEWTVNGELAQRRIQKPVRENQADWGVALARPLRLPARTAADRTLAGALSAHAEANLGEALHESGRQLLALWFA